MKPRLGPWKQDPDGDWVRYLDEDEQGGLATGFIVLVLTGDRSWFVYAGSMDATFLAEGTWPSVDVDEAKRTADAAAAQWYEIPEDSQSAPHGRYASPSGVRTHCARCGAALEFAGAGGMKCPVHWYDYK